MSARLRWLAVSVAGLVAMIAVFSFSPRWSPVTPPPVRLEGSVDSTIGRVGNELVVVPAPAVDIGADSTTVPRAAVTTVPTTDEQADAPSDDPADSDDDSVEDDAFEDQDDDAAGSSDSSADSPDD
jgi:hypothetical protein